MADMDRKRSSSARKRRKRKKRSGLPWQTGRNRYLATALAVIFVIALVFIVKNAADRHTYSSYEVVTQQDKSDSTSHYEYVGGRILRYSGDGVALLKNDFTVLWNESFSMMNPKAAVSGDQILVYDSQGTACNIYNSEEKLGSIETNLPILKADISKKGTVGVIMMDGTKSEFAYYKSDGSQIASGSATITDPGYPTDIAVSPNGENVAISYLNVDDGRPGSTVEFYNFGNAGSSKKNHMTASESFSAFVPELYYVSNTRCILIREDGFSVYRGSGNPEEAEKIDFDTEIVSAFHNDEYIAFLFRADTSQYRMNIYSAGGNELSSDDLSLTYNDARVSDDQILFYRNNALSIYNMKGFCRFEGELKEGNISDILKIGRNRYLVMTDEKMEIIRLK